MGYPTVVDFDKNIIKRTLENLDAKKVNSFTLLLNSLLGLIVLPRQWNLQGKRKIECFNKLLSEYTELSFFNTKTYFTDDDGQNIETMVLEFKDVNKTTITLKMIIDKLRHSIAHQALRPTKEEEKWKGVVFRNYKKDTATAKWNDEYDFQLYLTQDELEKFAKLIAEIYLTELDKE